ncbi:DUF7331 family protein [Halorientalis sp.]|uniref:DUF7331 family protein n=1 Tax=Halorientalis sp. TaxID=1931229 RepID=UPI0026301EF8|nr:hypothetical protein [Halorientalis sp.]
MARNHITDGSHRATTGPSVETVELATGGAVVYDRENKDAWIRAGAGATTDRTEVR